MGLIVMRGAVARYKVSETHLGIALALNELVCYEVTALSVEDRQNRPACCPD